MHIHCSSHRYHIAKRATYYSMLKNTSLGILKVILGFTGHSQALIADGLHSFSDLLTDILVLFASYWGTREADSTHPYGHQRIETAGSMLLAAILILTGFAIGYEAISLFCQPEITKPHAYVLVVALLSTLLNEILFQYTRHMAKKTKSDLLMANAWHHRSDGASSFIVLLGVLASTLGFHRFDPLAALIVGIIIIHMGVKLAWSSISELVDTAVDPDILKKIEVTIKETHGVLAIHQLRTRSMAGAIFVDVHVLVNPRLSVSEGHYIAEQVHQNLLNTIEHVKDVTVHIDSEDDTIVFHSLALPDRKELFRLLKAQIAFPWEDYSSQIILHYLKGKVFLDIYTDEIAPEKIPLLLSAPSIIPFIGGIMIYHTVKPT